MPSERISPYLDDQLAGTAQRWRTRARRPDSQSQASRGFRGKPPILGRIPDVLVARAGNDQEPSPVLVAWWLLAALGLLSAAAAIGLAVADASRLMVDFDVYRMGAAHVLGLHLYDVRLTPRPLHFTYPPFAALLFWPFAQLPVHVGQLIWSLLNLVMLVALTATSIHICRPQWSLNRTWTIAIIALFPALRLSPDLLTLGFGQVNFLIALLVLVDLTCLIKVRSHTLPRGVLLGIAAAIKLTPLIFIVFLLVTRRFRAGAMALGTFLICSLGAGAITPHSWLHYWSNEIFNAKRPGNLLYMSDQNLHSALQRLLSAPPSPILLVSLTLLFAVGGLAVATWAHRMSAPMLGILLCAATGLIISPVSWSHHYVWIVPLLAWLALTTNQLRGRWWWALGAAALFWAAPIWWVPNVQQGYGGPLVFLAGNSYFLAAVAFLLLGVALLWSRDEAATVTDTARSNEPIRGDSRNLPCGHMPDRPVSRSASLANKPPAVRP
jgi:alpha-1,2-mannosyltransferase